MLELQKYLLDGGTPDSLKKELGIRYYIHPTLALIGFKYNQIDSPRAHPVVRECRGIVLEDKTWKVVAKPFNRFFNVGECPDEFAEFNWSRFTCVNKEDGSLAIVYWYEDKWHMNTSGSFGLGQAPMYEGTWQDLFWSTVDFDKTKMDRGLTYIFELCTHYNRVVKSYAAPTLFLLGVNDIFAAHYEAADRPEEAVCAEARLIGAKRPKIYSASGQGDVVNLIAQMEKDNELEEGVVIRDATGMRFKWKTQKYLALHRLNDNGNILLPRNLVPIVLTGEVPETVAYFPVKDALAEVTNMINYWAESVADIWFVHGDMASQKKFALKYKDHKFAWLLFTLRKKYEWSSESILPEIRSIMFDNSRKVADILFGKKVFAFDNACSTKTAPTGGLRIQMSYNSLSSALEDMDVDQVNVVLDPEGDEHVVTLSVCTDGLMFILKQVSENVDDGDGELLNRICPQLKNVSAADILLSLLSGEDWGRYYLYPQGN